MKTQSTRGGLVYSTDSGRMCPSCRQPMPACQCQLRAFKPASDGTVRVSRESKGRAGKGVTVITGVPLNEQALIELGKMLKIACGSGGTVKEGVIEVQGDHVDRVMALLSAQAYKVKRNGG